MKGRSVWQRWLWDPATRREPWSAWDYLAASLNTPVRPQPGKRGASLAYQLGRAMKGAELGRLFKMLARRLLRLVVYLVVFCIALAGAVWLGRARLFLPFLIFLVITTFLWALLASWYFTKPRTLVRTTQERIRSIVIPLRTGTEEERFKARNRWRDRNDAWKELISIWPGKYRRRRGLIFAVSQPFMFFALCSIFLAISPLLLGMSMLSSDVWIILAMGIGGHMLFTWYARRLETACLRRIEATIREPVCPTCEYPLKLESPDGSAEDDQRDVLGPRHCPECGCRWPLVPPMVTFA